jgi:hypothetical protein
MEHEESENKIFSLIKSRISSSYEVFVLNIETCFQKWLYAKPQELSQNPDFIRFLEIFLHAQEHILNRNQFQADEVRKFYRSLISELINETKMKERMSFVDEEVFALFPRIIFSVQNEKNEAVAFEEIACELNAHLPTKEANNYPRFLGILVSLEDVKIIWVEDFVPDQTITKRQISTYNFSWSWFTLNHLIEHLKFNEPLQEFNPQLLFLFSKFYMLMEFIKKIVEEDL